MRYSYINTKYQELCTYAYKKMILPELTEIERVRKRLKLTQTELAKRSGVSQSLIARLEAGSVDPRYSKVAQIFKAIYEIKRQEITAKELMTPGVVGVQSTNTIEDTVHIMNKFKVSQMPVFSKRRVVGSITEKVVLDRIGKGADMRDFSSQKVGDFMDSPFPTVNLATPLTTLSKLLENDKAVIVMDRGELKGIVTNADLLKVVSR
jgi:predicted transcriptional regulator